MGVPPKGYLSAAIERRLDVAEDLAVFWLRPSAPLSFLPGQYVTLAVPGADGRIVKRAYSVVSAPHEERFELVVELVHGGALTPLLWPLRDGDAVWVRQRTAGRFLLDTARSHHVMACTVTGIAPFMSMIRSHAAARATGAAVDHRFLVVYGASHAVEHGPYRAELAALATEGWVVSVPTVSRPWEAPAWTGEVGRVEDVLRKHLDALGWGGDDTAGYACGNPQMIETVRGVLRRARLPDAHIHEETYFTVAASPASPAPASPAPTPAPRSAVRPGAPGGIVLKTVPRRDAG